MIRDNNTRFRINAFFFTIILFGFFIIEHEFAFSTANQLNERNIIATFQKEKLALQESLGVLSIPEVSGEEIYNAKCIACHQFDVKIVGPPYNDVLPKYENKMDELESFIANPVKINPDYPIMPNQGLKPAEVKAIAEYIVTIYNSNK
jgi:cytochrome c